MLGVGAQMLLLFCFNKGIQEYKIEIARISQNQRAQQDKNGNTLNN